MAIARIRLLFPAFNYQNGFVHLECHKPCVHIAFLFLILLHLGTHNPILIMLILCYRCGKCRKPGKVQTNLSPVLCCWLKLSHETSSNDNHKARWMLKCHWLSTLGTLGASAWALADSHQESYLCSVLSFLPNYSYQLAFSKGSIMQSAASWHLIQINCTYY